MQACGARFVQVLSRERLHAHWNVLDAFLDTPRSDDDFRDAACSAATAGQLDVIVASGRPSARTTVRFKRPPMRCLFSLWYAQGKGHGDQDVAVPGAHGDLQVSADRVSRDERAGVRRLEPNPDVNGSVPPIQDFGNAAQYRRNVRCIQRPEHGASFSLCKASQVLAVDLLGRIRKTDGDDTYARRRALLEQRVLRSPAVR